VVDNLVPLYDVGYCAGISDIPTNEPERSTVLLREPPGIVLGAFARQVVERCDLGAGAEKGVDDVAADKAASAGNEDSGTCHRTPLAPRLARRL
jgi:hypothetical protein